MLLYIPPGAPQAGFLLLAENGPLLQLGLDPPSAILPFRLQRTVRSDLVAFCHCFTGHYLCAVPLVLGGAEGVLAVDRVECGGWETFRLIPAESPNLGAAASTAVTALARWSERPIMGPEVYDLIARGVRPAEAAAFDAFCRLLPLDQLHWLGPTILGRPDALSNLACTFPTDLFASEALLDLSRWLAARPKAIQGHLSADLDELASTGLDGQYASFPHMCNAFARLAVPARKPVCILATARNEGLYLLEWIAYHRSIGVDGFFIYSNDNDDGSDKLLAALAKARVITWISSEVKTGGSAQPKAYGHALSMLPDILDFRWTLIIDLDEFFVFDSTRFSSISHFVEWQEARPVDAIAFNWLVFGSNGEDRWQDAPLSVRFTRRLPWLDPHIKTMVRTNRIMQSRPHHPVVDSRQTLVTRNASGHLHVTGQAPSFSAEPEAKAAWINHFFLKSAEEFVWKFSRNRGDHALVRGFHLAAIDGEFLDMFVSQHQSPHVTPDTRMQDCGKEMSQHYATLLSLPGVGEALTDIQHGFSRTIAQLKAGLASMPRFRTPGTSQAKLLGFLGL
jgi:hypothetical protein